MLTGQILLFNKPYKWTSFDVVRKVKGALVARYKREHAEDAANAKRLKVGHAGTLDPLATGLLVICTGPFTKKITEIQDSEKEYTGTFVLGATTASHDLESEVIPGTDVKFPDSGEIRRMAERFTGIQQQTPPAHSAVKVNGKRAYELARKGKTVEIKSKEIEIKEFEITGINLPEVSFRVVCTKGTYIRSLAADFGAALGTGAYLSGLCRTRIGSYRLQDAVDPLEFARQLSE